jgi:hypothetical protein
MILIESDEGILYRGNAVLDPAEVWDYPRKHWVPFVHRPTIEPGWGREIDEARAEVLKTDNPAAEHYPYYDTRHGPSGRRLGSSARA